MGKLRSNRVKRTPQAGITPDRYQFLGLEQAEPNLGDAEIGPSSAAANPIKLGRPYQLYAVGEYPGERYWAPAIGGGTSIGVISVYANGLLSSSLFQNINGLNFVGTGVTIESPPVEIADGVGIATVRITVTDILNRGQVGQVLYNTPSGYAYGADGLYYVSGNVGIGSTLPKQALDVSGNGIFSGTVTATKFIGNIEGTFTGTATTATNVIGGIASVTSLSVSGVSSFGGNLLPSTTGLSIGNLGNRWENFYVNTIVGNLTGAASSIAVYQDSTDTIRYIPFVDVATGISSIKTSPSLTFNPSTGNLGIGTNNPGESLQVDGNIRVGISTTSNYIAFRGTYGDGEDGLPFAGLTRLPYKHTFIGERIYEPGTEKSELLLFKGNDFSDANIYGPDRIRLAATGGIVFDTSTKNLNGTFEEVGISTALITRMVLTSKGNLGIGTTNPQAALEVGLGSVYISNGDSWLNGTTYVFNTRNNRDGYWTNGGTDGGSYYTNVAPGGRVGFRVKIPGAGATTGTFGEMNTENIIYTMSTRHNGAEGITDFRGRLAIGTTDPTSTLHVQGTANIQAGIGTTGLVWYFTSDKKNVIQSSLDEEYYSPQISVLVQPDQIYYAPGEYDPVTFSHAAISTENSTPLLRSFNNYTNAAGITSNAIVDATGFYTRVSRNSAADVSYNTAGQLRGILNQTIQGTNVSSSTLTSNAIGIHNIVGIRKANATDVIITKNSANIGNSQVSIQNTFVSNAYGSYNEGNVGTATTTLTGIATLTNYYGYYSQPRLFPNGRLTNYYGVYLATPEISAGGTLTNRYSIYSPDASSPMYHAGNLGIGTTNPQAALDVGTGNAYISNGDLHINGTPYIFDTRTSRGGYWTNGGTDGIANFGNITPGGSVGFSVKMPGVGATSGTFGAPDTANMYDTVRSRHDGAEGVTDFRGRVGIGTTNPTEKLTVSGTILAEGFISVGNTTPIQISLVGNKLTFTASGIGSTTLTLF